MADMNCTSLENTGAQRAHYNFIENYNSFLPALLVAGTRYPLIASGLGATWAVCRVLFAVGYTRKDKNNGEGRLVGLGFWLCQLGLYGMTGAVGWKMIA